MASPNKSLVVVIKGPDASAGLKPTLFSNNGVTVPKNDAINTTKNKAIETIMDKLPCPPVSKLKP